MKADLSDKVAFITGGAAGIGHAIASLFVENGAAVVIADVNGERARAAAAGLPGAIAVQTDIREQATISDALNQALDAFGRIDILVNNAGVNTIANRVPIDIFPVEEWHRIVGIDLDGTFFVTRTIAPVMIRQRSGRIINIASTLGLAAMRFQSPFVAAKAGIIHLTRSMALELGPKGILVNAIAPGSTLTDVTKKLFFDQDGLYHERTTAFLRHVPLGRPARPEEIAQGALFLACSASSYVSGHCLTIDGGWTAGYMV